MPGHGRKSSGVGVRRRLGTGTEFEPLRRQVHEGEGGRHRAGHGRDPGARADRREQPPDGHAPLHVAVWGSRRRHRQRSQRFRHARAAAIGGCIRRPRRPRAPEPVVGVSVAAQPMAPSTERFMCSSGSHSQAEIVERFEVTVVPAPDFVVFDRADTLRAMLECKGAERRRSRRPPLMAPQEQRQRSGRCGRLSTSPRRPCAATLRSRRSTLLRGTSSP